MSWCAFSTLWASRPAWTWGPSSRPHARRSRSSAASSPAIPSSPGRCTGTRPSADPHYHTGGHLMSNRVAMVTGGAQGIGKGIATALAAEALSGAVADLHLTAAEQTAKEITATGGTAIAVEIDVTRTASVESAVRAVEAALGPVEAVVNNAGWGDFMPFVKTTGEVSERIRDINFKGGLRVIKAVVPGMM